MELIDRSIADGLVLSNVLHNIVAAKPFDYYNIALLETFNLCGERLKGGNCILRASSRKLWY